MNDTHMIQAGLFAVQGPLDEGASSIVHGRRALAGTAVLTAKWDGCSAVE